MVVVVMYPESGKRTGRGKNGFSGERFPMVEHIKGVYSLTRTA
jgi:hypothetical protein